MPAVILYARTEEQYNSGHIITARHAKWDNSGNVVLPLNMEVEGIRYIIVYDVNSSSLSGSGTAHKCAETLAKVSLYPVHLLSGGYKRFSALYPFFRTQKILYTIKELESLSSYPVEILPGLLYMGDYKQATTPFMMKDLKVSAFVNVSDQSSIIFEKGHRSILDVRVADTMQANLYSSFDRICMFVGSRLKAGTTVMIFSSLGISRCSAVTMAVLVGHLKYSLKDAWAHVLQCKNSMRPNRAFVQQLSDWELQSLGQRMTDISEPNY
ncbi:serine/threonine/tyrosine-interacting-like protein 1 isoform X2 [Alosa sapidissima]|uniref:serine/threonine/tyrosine-interacting-like protein 1 isoform X2 n=1 Tax=Alosa sapidissima TaxID=34773 RepID=UPI001C097CFF|nr:serine/threonine/tyrosine-interacting-like protein 1 isoform X2 [Alosa sapidissima]